VCVCVCVTVVTPQTIMETNHLLFWQKFVLIFLGVPLRVSHLWLIHRAIGCSKYCHAKIFSRFPFSLIESLRSALYFFIEESKL